MKLANNMLAANVLVATAEVVVMGVKAGLDPAVMIEVLNAGSGATSASRDKFPRAILPRTFDYGFATGLMVKDLRLYLDEAKALGVPVEVAEAIGRIWEAAARDQGPDSDFTTVIKRSKTRRRYRGGSAVRRRCSGCPTAAGLVFVSHASYRPLGNLGDADHASPAARRMILSSFKNDTCGLPAILTTTRPDD